MVEIADPLKLAAHYSDLIRADQEMPSRWDQIDGELLRALLMRLSNDARWGLDSPLDGVACSGDQAKEALKKLFSALTGGPGLGGRRGPRNRVSTLKARIQEQADGIIFRKTLRVAGAPGKSYSEYLAWEAMELAGSKDEASRREVSLFDVFKEKILPRLEYWREPSDRLRVVRERHLSALATIGAAGAPTKRAVRDSLRLSSRSQRRRGEIPRLASEVDPRAYKELVAKGLKVLGGKTPS